MVSWCGLVSRAHDLEASCFETAAFFCFWFFAHTCQGLPLCVCVCYLCLPVRHSRPRSLSTCSFPGARCWQGSTTSKVASSRPLTSSRRGRPCRSTRRPSTSCSTEVCGTPTRGAPSSTLSRRGTPALRLKKLLATQTPFPALPRPHSSRNTSYRDGFMRSWHAVAASTVPYTVVLRRSARSWALGEQFAATSPDSFAQQS